MGQQNGYKILNWDACILCAYGHATPAIKRMRLYLLRRKPAFMGEVRLRLAWRLMVTDTKRNAPNIK